LQGGPSGVWAQRRRTAGGAEPEEHESGAEGSRRQEHEEKPDSEASFDVCQAGRIAAQGGDVAVDVAHEPHVGQVQEGKRDEQAEVAESDGARAEGGFHEKSFYVVPVRIATGKPRMRSWGRAGGGT